MCVYLKGVIDFENGFHNCVLLSNIALNRSVRKKSLGQGFIFTGPIFSFHVVNHKYFSICEELYSGAIRENSTALIKMWHFLGVSPPPTKKYWGRSCCLLRLYKEKCKESDRPRSVFVPKQNVSQSSTEVTESQYTSPTSGGKMFCEIC